MTDKKSSARELVFRDMTGKEKILRYLEEVGAATDEEIAKGCKMNPSSARTRRLELEQDGIIRPIAKVKTTSGRLTYLWVIKP